MIIARSMGGVFKVLIEMFTLKKWKLVSFGGLSGKEKKNPNNFSKTDTDICIAMIQIQEKQFLTEWDCFVHPVFKENKNK